MSDEFGGIPVDEPQTDEFGGVAVAEPIQEKEVERQQLAQQKKQLQRERFIGEQEQAIVGAAQDIANVASIPARPILKLPRSMGTGVGAGLANLAAGAAEGVSAPAYWLLGGSAALRALVAGQLAGNLPRSIPAAIQTVRNPQATTAEKVEAVGQPILEAGGAGLLARTPSTTKVIAEAETPQGAVEAAEPAKVTPEALPAPREAIPEVKPEVPQEAAPTEEAGGGAAPTIGEKTYEKVPSTESAPLESVPSGGVTWKPSGTGFNVFTKDAQAKARQIENGDIVLRNVSVSEGKRGQGLGRRFIDELIGSIPGQFPNSKNVIVWAFDDAMGFWEKSGFKPTGRSQSTELGDISELSKKVPPAGESVEAQPSAGPVGATVETPVTAGVTPQAIPESGTPKPTTQEPSVTGGVTIPDNGRVEYRVPATGKTKRFIKWNGQWFKDVGGVTKGRPLDPDTKLVSALDRQLGKETPIRETITPSEDTSIGQNSAGEKLYQRKDGQVYRMRTDSPRTKPYGYPDFGGDLSPVTEPPGPGAQTPGEPEYSAISQLTDRLKATPKVGLSESIPLKERAAEAWSEGKSGVAKSIGTMRAVTESLKETAKGVRDITELDRRVGEFDRAIQTSAGKSKESGRAIERQIPNKSIRDAVALWVDAGGNEKAISETLSKLPEGTSPRIRRALEMAAKLPPEAKQFAQDLKQFFSIREQDAMQGELFEKGLEDYYTHIWEKEGNMPEALRAAISNGKLSTYFQFARQRKIPQLLQGILEGKTPILDPAKVVPFYNYAMDRALASRKFIRDASESVEKDGRPTLSPSGKSIPIERGDTPEGLIIKPKARSEQNADYRQIDHPALRKWKWAGTDQNGKPILYQSDLLVHPDAYDRLANMLDRGRLSPTKIGRALLAASTEVKGFKLGLLSAFHVVHVGSHAMWHWTSPFKALELGKPIEWDSPRVQFAIEKGHLKIAPDPAELKVLSEGLMGGGLVHKIPLIGPISRVWSEWTFGDFIPKLKLATFDNALKRNMEHYAKDIQAGKITPDQIASRVGDSVNNAYGELNHLFLGKFGRDPRFQRLLRGIFLAPDFGEARLRFVEKAFTKYGFEERLALLTMFTTMYVGARVANWITHGDPEMDWKKAFSVKSGEHWYSMRSVIGDLDRAASDFGRFMYVRLNPLYSRTLADFLFGRDVSGRKLTVGEKFGNIGKQLVPIQFGGLTRDDQKLWESFVTAMGVSTIRDRPEQDVHRFVNDWMKTNPDPKIQEKYTRREAETFARSQYFPLRFALENEDYEKARNELSKLTKTHNQQQITKAMSPEFKAFGGLNSAEFNRFLKSMTPEQRKLYNEALENRKLLYRRYLTLIHPKATREE